MTKHKQYTFVTNGKPHTVKTGRTGSCSENRERAHSLKRELVAIFRKFGYLPEGKDYEVRIRTTSGNIAWITINSVETIK